MPEAFTFVAGGAVQAGGGLYLERDADRELLRHCLDGNFTYVLTSRQMGKSSLMYRAAEQLYNSGARPVIIDLTELGAQTTADQWYKGFLLLVQEQLGLRSNASEWWDTHAQHAYAHRLIRYLREVALVERPERLVLFVDEIDTTLRLDFTDDFFAAIRFLYQSRATDRELERISFVLIGVATPNDLIKDAARTPFNIGHRIELTDFTRAEASVIAAHLAAPPGIATGLMEAMLRWTGGHPYLTMRLLRSLADSPPAAWTIDAIDARIHELFLGPSGETDTNLQFVRDMLTRKAFNREAVLSTYETIRTGARVPDRELDQVASWLKLSGIVRRQDGLLRVRNVIYERVFDERWARVHRSLNINWRRRLTRAAIALLVVIVLVAIPLALYALQQKSAAENALRQAEVARDNAQRQRDLAEGQLLTTQDNLRTAQDAVAALKEFDPKAAAQLSTELTTARTTAEKELGALTAERERIRRERDEAVALLQKANQELAALRRQPQGAQRTAPQEVDVPNLVNRQVADIDGQLGTLGLRHAVRLVEDAAPLGTVVTQSPRAGSEVAVGSLVTVSVSRGPVETRASPPPDVRITDDTAQVLRVLQRYKAGYEALDAKAIAAVYPAANVSGLESRFKDISRLGYDMRVGVDGIVIAADGQSATVTTSETFRVTPKVGGPTQQANTATFTLRKAGAAWQIQGVKTDNRN